MKKQEMNSKFLLLAVILFSIFTSNCKKDKINPIIIWENPIDIIYGTPLSTTQLNATSDVPGIFVYTPTFGTILNEGDQQDLKVDFTPTDDE